MKNSCILFSLLAWFLSGCTYEPEGTFTNPYVSPPPDQIAAAINIDDVEGEFALVISTSFKVNIDRAGKRLVYFTVTKEGQPINSLGPVAPDQYLFNVDPAHLEQGTHQYDIEAKLSSGSGSIAEARGLEYYLIRKKLVVTVDKRVPSAVTGITPSMEAGHMTLRWNKPAHDHYFYVIVRNDVQGNYQSATISDPDVTEYIDEGYLGGKVSYTITLQSSFFVVPSEPVAYDFNPMESVSMIDENNRLKLKWTMQYQFGDDVFIRTTGRNFTMDFPATSGEAVVDTIYLGDIATSSLQLFRKGFEDDGLQIGYTSSIGTKMKLFDQYSLIESSNKLILSEVTNGRKTYRYNINTSVVEDSVYFPASSGNLRASQDGQYQYFASGSFLNSFNPLDFSAPGTSIYLNSIYQNDLQNPAIYAVSNDNFVVLGNQHKIVTMDLTNKQLWGTEKNGTKAVVSGDGNLMVVTDIIFESDAVIYKRGLTDWEEMGKVPHGNMFFSRLPNPQLISSLNGVTKLFDLTATPNADGYFVETTSAPVQATAFDIVNNRILSETIDSKLISTISVYSLEDLHLIATVKARVSSNWLNYSHFVLGGSHFTTSGFINAIE